MFTCAGTDFTESDQDQVLEDPEEDLDDYTYPDGGYDQTGTTKNRMLTLPPPLFHTQNFDDFAKEESEEEVAEEGQDRVIEGDFEEDEDDFSEKEEDVKKIKPRQITPKKPEPKRDLNKRKEPKHKESNQRQAKTKQITPKRPEPKKDLKKREEPKRSDQRKRSTKREEEKGHNGVKPSDLKPSKPIDNGRFVKAPKGFNLETDSLLYLIADPRKLKRSALLQPASVPKIVSQRKEPEGDKRQETVDRSRSLKRDSSKSHSRTPSVESVGSIVSTRSNTSGRESRRSSAPRRESTRSSASRSSASHSDTSRRESTRSSASRSDTSRRESTRSETSRRESTLSSDSRRQSTRSDTDKRWTQREEKRDRQRERGSEMRRGILDEEEKEKRELIYEFYLMEQNKIPVSKK